MKILINKSTEKDLENFIIKPSHAVLLLAPVGAGKSYAAKYLSSRLLGVDLNKLDSHPYMDILRPVEGKTISIDAIREVIHFTNLKSTLKSDVKRIVVIENSQYLSVQAQNALLKTIEEPPEGTIIILTAPSELSLLPTIRSRIQKIILHQPERDQTIKYFEAFGYSQKIIDKALLMSGGMPGLMQALLESDDQHPLMAATIKAREILQKSTFERIAMINESLKDKKMWMDIMFILGKMADVALLQAGNDTTAVKRWQKISKAAYLANRQISANTQLKLVLLNFMLVL